MNFQDALVKVIFKGVDMMSAPMKIMEKHTQALESKIVHLSKVGSQMSSLGTKGMFAGAGVLAGVGGIMKEFATLESVQVDLENAFRGAGGRISPAFKDLQNQIAKAGQVLPGTEEDFAKLAIAMRMAGMDAETLSGGAFTAASQLKVLFDLNPEDAGRQFVAMAKAMGISGAESGAFADQIQRLRYATGINLQEMQDSIPYASAALKGLGIQGLESSRSVLTLAGVLKQSGIEGSKGGTAMAQMLQKLAELTVRFEHTTDARGAVMKAGLQALKKEGVNLEFFDKNGKFMGVENMLAQFPKLAKLTDKQRLLVAKLFGQSGMQAVMMLANEKAFQEMAAKFADQEDLATRFNHKTQTLGASWEALTGSVVSSLRRIGESLKPTLMPMLQGLNEMLGKVGDWIKANPKIVGGIMNLVAGFGALALVGGSALFAIGKIVTLGTTLAPLLVSMAPLWPAFLFGAMAAGILATGIYLVWKHADKLVPELTALKDETGMLWSNLKDTFQAFNDINVGMDAFGEKIGLGELGARVFVDQIRNLVTMLNLAVASLRQLAAMIQLAFAPMMGAFAALEAMQQGGASGKGFWESVGTARKAFTGAVSQAGTSANQGQNEALGMAGNAIDSRATSVFKFGARQDLENARWAKNSSMASHSPITIQNVNVQVGASDSVESVRRAGADAAERAYLEVQRQRQRRDLRTGPDTFPTAFQAAH